MWLCSSIELLHIKQSERVTIGLNGNLYFANVQINNTRNDYTCYVQYIEASTILATETISLIVKPCEWLEPAYIYTKVYFLSFMYDTKCMANANIASSSSSSSSSN